MATAEAQGAYFRLFEKAGVRHWELDVQGGRLRFPGLGNAAGADEALDDRLKKVHPDDLAPLREALERCALGEDVDFYAEVRLGPAAEERWVSLRGHVAKADAEGRAQLIVGYEEDVTGAKHTEQMLYRTLEENERYSRELQRDVAAVAESLRVSKSDLLRRGRLLTMVNRLATSFLAAEAEQLEEVTVRALQEIGESVNADRVFLMENDEQAGRACVHLTYDWVQATETQARWKRGDIFYFDAFEGWWDRLRAGEAINSHVVDLHGGTRDFFAGLGVQSLLVIPLHIQNEFWGVAYLADSYKVRLSDEPEVKTLESGAILTVLNILRSNATVNLKEAMGKAQAATKAKSLFLSNMSHEMRTPLNVIIGMTAIARQGPDDLGHCLDRVDSASRHLLGLIDSVLDMAKLEADRLELATVAFCPAQLLVDVQAMHAAVAGESGLLLSADAAGLEETQLLGDKLRLAQVLNELVSNAIKFTPAGGRIELTARLRGEDAAGVTLALGVRDTGIGLGEDVRRTMFDPFVQGEAILARTYEGAGLGLAMVRGLVELMGGSIEVDGAQGGGSSFTVVVKLPRATAVDAGATPLPGGRYDFTGRRILLAEDNEINCMVVSAILEDTGAEVDCAENGLKALELIERPGMTYDLVLMDIQMPEMDGYEATRRIRALPMDSAAAVPIIAVTANAFEDDVARCRAAGMDGHVAKPVDGERLLAELARFLRAG